MRIFFDMDGVLAKWNADASPEDLISPGYFRAREADMVAVTVVKMLAMSGIPIWICSKYLNNSCMEDKNRWLDEYVPEAIYARRIFVPYGESKENIIPGGAKTKDILVDDYSVNLRSWPGIGIKYMNGLNGTKGTWKGLRINRETMSPEEIFYLLSSMHGRLLTM